MPGRSSSKYRKYQGYEAHALEREAEEARMREEVEMQELRNARGGSDKRKGGE